MKYFNEKIETPFSNNAYLTCYILDNIKYIDQNRLRPAVIICPGGAYRQVTKHDGEPIAIKCLSMGIQSFILNYSISPIHHPAQLSELATAVKILRDHYLEWNIDPDKIIVMGLSAGGHLAGMLATMWNSDILKNIGYSSNEIKPNGLVMGYPVVTGYGDYCHLNTFKNLLGEKNSLQERQNLSIQNLVSDDTPISFIWTTVNDTVVPMENSLMLVKALRNNKINCEFHLFSKGNHGHSLANRETSVSQDQIIPSLQVWPTLLFNWIKEYF